MLKRFKIDNRMQEVFVLRQSENRIVYVPVKSMHRVDYERFKELSEKKPPRADLLEFMSKTKLKNGVNALVQYDSIIHVANVNKEVGTRIKKTEEIIGSFEHNAQIAGDAHTKEQPQIVYVQAPVQQLQSAVQSDVQDDVQSLSTKESDNHEKPVYRFRNKHGKIQEWGSHGRMPDFLKEVLDSGGDIEQYRVV